MYCIEEKTWDMVGTFRRPPVTWYPGHCSPFPIVAPLMWHFATKLRSCEIRRTLNAEQLVRNERSQLRYFDHVSRMPHERLARHGVLAKPTRKRPRSRPRPRRSDRISDLAWSHLGVEPAEPSEIAVDRDVFHVLLGLLPQRPFIEEKRAWMNWITSALFSAFTGV